jgi:hypothetical protein
MLWYVYRFNGVAEDFECVGAFSREDEARVCLARERAEWKESSNGALMADHLFPGACIRETWSEFCERVFRYRLGKLAAPIDDLAKRISGAPSA